MSLFSQAAEDAERIADGLERAAGAAQALASQAQHVRTLNSQAPAGGNYLAGTVLGPSGQPLNSQPHGFGVYAGGGGAMFGYRGGGGTMFGGPTSYTGIGSPGGASGGLVSARSSGGGGSGNTPYFSGDHLLNPTFMGPLQNPTFAGPSQNPTFPGGLGKVAPVQDVNSGAQTAIGVATLNEIRGLRSDLRRSDNGAGLRAKGLL